MKPSQISIGRILRQLGKLKWTKEFGAFPELRIFGDGSGMILGDRGQTAEAFNNLDDLLEILKIK